MNGKGRQRYVLAVYLLLAALSVIFALLGTRLQETNPLRGLFLNLSTEVAGVVLIFFVVNQLFLLDRDRDLLKEIETIRNSIKSRFSPLLNEPQSYEQFRLEDLIEGAHSIDLLGLTLVNLFSMFRDSLVEAIREGAHVRVVLVDLASPAGELMHDAMYGTDVYIQDAKRSLAYIAQIEDSIKEIDATKGSLAVKVTSWLPSCSIIIVDGDNETGIMKVGINSPSRRVPVRHGYHDRLFLILKREEYPAEFEYFRTRFDLLFDDSNTVPWNSTQDART